MDSKTFDPLYNGRHSSWLGFKPLPGDHLFALAKDFETQGIRRRPEIDGGNLCQSYRDHAGILFGLNMGYSDRDIARLMESSTHNFEGFKLLGRKKGHDIHYVQFIRQLVQIHSRKTDAK